MDFTQRTDRELVLLSRQGHAEAFGCLIERYQALAERIALRMVNVQDIAQDLVQEAMLQAFLSLEDLQKEDSFRSWLYGIVLNVSKNFLRNEKRRSQFNEPLAEESQENPWSASSDSQDPQQIVIERELHSLVLSAIEELPPAYQESARLHYYESLTLHEIAAITGASPGAIKVRLYRARNHLRTRLHQVYPEVFVSSTTTERRKIMVKANIVDIVKIEDKYMVLLQDETQQRILPMWVGTAEGTAIALGLRAYPTVRPMTFDFITHLLDALGAQLEEVRVEVLKDFIFYGIAKVRTGNETKEVDARPSDVLALAVRTNSPVYVSEEVMQQAGMDLTAYEKEYRKFTPGEGVEEILKEFDAILKQFDATLKENQKLREEALDAQLQEETKPPDESA